MEPPIDLRVVGDRIEELLGQLERDPRRPRLGAGPGRRQPRHRAVRRRPGADPRARAERRSTSRERLADDDLVASLLVLHDLHPLDLDDRVRAALDSVRPYLGSHGGDVEVLDIDGDAGVVSLRMLGSCDGCASSSVTLELAVQRGHRGGRARDHPDRRRSGECRRARRARAQPPSRSRSAASPPARSRHGADLRPAGPRSGAGRPARDRGRRS